jgi:hypothetical protein
MNEVKMKDEPLQKLGKNVIIQTKDEFFFVKVLCTKIILEIGQMHCVGHFIVLS